MRSAVDSSWFTEEVRVLMAAFGSLLLLGLGVGLHERRGNFELARIIVAAALPALYATTVIASQTYDLISPVIGLEAAALIGAVGVFIAVRWSSMLVAGVGILGALAAPILAELSMTRSPPRRGSRRRCSTTISPANRRFSRRR